MIPKAEQWIKNLEESAFNIFENGQTGELMGTELYPTYSKHIVLHSLAEKKELFRRNKDYIDLLKDFYSGKNEKPRT